MTTSTSTPHLANETRGLTSSELTHEMAWSDMQANGWLYAVAGALVMGVLAMFWRRRSQRTHKSRLPAWVGERVDERELMDAMRPYIRPMLLMGLASLEREFDRRMDRVERRIKHL